MKNIIFESILVAASLALWLVVLPVAALLSPVLLVLRPGGGPTSAQRPTRAAVPVPAGAGLIDRGDSFMIEALGTNAIQAVERITQLIPFLREMEEKAKEGCNPHGEIVD